MAYQVLTTIIDDPRLILTEKLIISLLTDDAQKDALLRLCEENLENDYIKNYHSLRPNEIDMDYIEYDIDIKFNRNKYYTENQSEFERLFYTIALKTQEIIGHMELFDHGNCVTEVAIFISHKHSRKGYATEALNAIVDFVKYHSNISTIKWECYSDDAESIGLAKKCGFSYVKDDTIYDNRMTSLYELKIHRQQNIQKSFDPFSFFMSAAKFLPIIASFYFVHRLFV